MASSESSLEEPGLTIVYTNCCLEVEPEVVFDSRLSGSVVIDLAEIELGLETSSFFVAISLFSAIENFFTGGAVGAFTSRAGAIWSIGCIWSLYLNFALFFFGSDLFIVLQVGVLEFGSAASLIRLTFSGFESPGLVEE